MRGAALHLHRLFKCAATALRLAAALLPFVLVLLPAHARAAPPPRGSPIRAAIIDAVRPLVEAEVGAPVVLFVKAINVEGPFAFVSMTPARPGGQPIDWSRTRHARAKAADMISDVSQALLSGGDQSWSVIEFAFGPTDVPWEAWVSRHRAPRRLFEQAYDQAQADSPAVPAAAPSVSPSAPPPPPPAPAQPQPKAQPWAPGPDWRVWRLGDLTFATPPGWGGLDSQTRALKIGGEPWNATFSDAPMNAARAAMLVFSWADDEFIYSNGLDAGSIIGRGRQVFANLEGDRISFKLRDRYNDAQGFDVIARGVGGATFHMGCRAPAQRWAQMQDVCERILASLRLDAPAATSAKPAPAASATPVAPAAPVAPVATKPAPAPDARDAAFRAYTLGVEKIEAFEKGRAVEDWKAGFEAAQQAVALQPEVADYWRLVGYAASLGAQDSALARQSAEDAYARAVALDPGNSGARLLYAGLLIKRESWSRALDQIEAAVTAKPDLATSPVIADMTRMYLLDKQGARGLAFFAKLSAQRPRAQAIRLGQAILAKETGRKDEATALAEKVAADPQAAQTDAEHAKALLKALKE
jgi:hypothetical protein